MADGGLRTTRALLTDPPAGDEDRDLVEIELAELYIERERLMAADHKTAIRKQRVHEHRERLEKQISRLEAMRA